MPHQHQPLDNLGFVWNDWTCECSSLVASLPSQQYNTKSGSRTVQEVLQMKGS